jgi:16S rRNA (uracil1498-N3)-methyltransferase
MKTPRDPKSQRLFLRASLSAGKVIDLDRAQANYLVNVLRLPAGAEIRVFNGHDGEWTAALASEGRKDHRLVIGEQRRPQTFPPDLHYIFVPLKQARLDYMVEKAVELGVGRLRPVLAQHGQVTRLNTDRMVAHAIEAAEQCGLLSIPAIDEPIALAALIENWPEREGTRCVVFCDEGNERSDPLTILSGLSPSPLAILVGPEGGFSADERQMLLSRPFVTALPLGPRIMRADTAAVAALALAQAALGDWRNAPPSPYSR